LLSVNKAGLRVLVSKKRRQDSGGQNESIYYYNGVWPATGSAAVLAHPCIQRDGLDLHRIAGPMVQRQGCI
jgi:hypothetical protein